MPRILSRQEALNQAEEVLDTAWDAQDSNARVAIAQRALEISPICADAYVILASKAEPGSDRQLELWRGGVQAGELALGEAFFRECEGEFWGFLESRPYMRARLGLALALWTHGEKDEAIEHLRELVRLNPNDNQGNRYILVAYCIETGRDNDADVILKGNADDDGAYFEWSRALLAFRRHGDNAATRKVLSKAQKSNEHVPDYLLGKKKLPKQLPGFYGIGDTNEAIFYTRDFRRGWEMTPGALDWLRSCAMAKPKRK